jgi:hypothetical protein
MSTASLDFAQKGQISTWPSGLKGCVHPFIRSWFNANVVFNIYTGYRPKRKGPPTLRTYTLPCAIVLPYTLTVIKQ